MKSTDFTHSLIVSLMNLKFIQINIIFLNIYSTFYTRIVTIIVNFITVSIIDSIKYQSVYVNCNILTFFRLKLKS